MNINFYSFMPCLHTEIGHIYAYHTAVATSSQLNGWNHYGIIPKSCTISNIPPNWYRVLCDDPWDGNWPLRKRLLAVVKNMIPLIKLFRKNKHSKSIVLIEHGWHHLPSLIITLLLIRPNMKIWILHRYDYHPKSTRAKLFRFLHRLIGKKRITLLTDSELLAHSQSKVFQRPVHTLPIPHTTIHTFRESPTKRLHLWWPGGSIREDKGLKYIQLLAQAINSPDPKLKLILADKAKPLFKAPHQNIQFIKTELTSKEYNHWMNTVDFVLLPYDPNIYHSSTSGIFVEAVVAGAYPLTIEGTWMARELKRFDLRELILNWKDNDLYSIHLINKLLALQNNEKIRKQFLKMQEYYQNFHSPENFAKHMKKLVECLSKDR